MARGARMSEQRRSARDTMRDRREGRNENSRGSTVRDNQRASQNRQAAQKRDTEKRTQKALASQPEVRSLVLSAASTEDYAEYTEGYQKGFTNTAEATTAGNVVGIGLGSVAGSAVESAAEKVGEMAADTPSGPFEAAGRTAGKAAATSTGIGLGGGLTEKAVSLGLSALGPIGQTVKAGLQQVEFEKASFAGEKALQSSKPTSTRKTAGRQGESNTGTSPSSSVGNETQKPSATSIVKAPTVKSIVPSIGISSGTDERKANFGGALAIRGKKVGTKRGKV